jgi:hypothetical protein
LIERPYQEIVDDLLTAIVGGVVNEPIFFDVKEDRYALAQPADDVRSITGTLAVTGPDAETQLVHHSFQKSVDFIFSAGDNAVIWQRGGARPEDETVFYVDYFRPPGASRSPLSDINVGSVTRTLSEAIGREIATVYQQIKQAYLAGFIDTAKGQALDLVVSILGVERKTKEFAVGLVTFFRDLAAGDGNITIPEGVVLSTDKGEASFVTVESRTLQRGQVRIDAPVRASGASKGEAGIVPAGAITKIAQPIIGIARVTNFEATGASAENESDEQLRLRAKATLRGLGKATVAALANAVFESRAILAEVFDPNSPPAKRTPNGTVTLLIESEPERFPSLQAAIEQTRAAGVKTTLVARYVFFKPRIVARLAATGLTAVGKEKIKNQIIEAIQQYVDTLSAGDPAKGEELIKAITSVKEVSKKKEETKIVDVIAFQSDLARPGAEAVVSTLAAAIEVVLASPEAADPTSRSKALIEALSAVLSEASPLTPTGQRIPNRNLVQGPTGQRATDAEIEAGQFQVAAMVDGEKWWVVLDIEPADLVMTEG